MSVGAGVGYLTTVPLSATVTAAGVVAALLVGHGLFVNGPVDSPDDRTGEVDPLN